MIHMGMFQGPRYIEALLERINLMKKFFILELEWGHEVIIPRDLSQDYLPKSYRYYDFLLRFIQDNISKELSLFQKMKNNLEETFDNKLSIGKTLYLTKKEYRSYQNKLRTYARLTLKIEKDLQIAKLNKKMDKKYELDMTLICAMYKIIKDWTDYRHVVIVRM